MASDTNDRVCPTCEGDGSFIHRVTVPACCFRFLPSGECCGEAVPAEKIEQECCPTCHGSGRVKTVEIEHVTISRGGSIDRTTETVPEETGRAALQEDKTDG